MTDDARTRFALSAAIVALTGCLVAMIPALALSARAGNGFMIAVTTVAMVIMLAVDGMFLRKLVIMARAR